MGLFFVYGSLLAATGNTQVDKAMVACEPLGRGYIHGRLYDLGPYPGVLPAEAEAPQEASHGAPKVWGMLMAIRDPETLFTVLDPYEGFHPDALRESEYVRSTAQAFLPDPETGAVKVYASQVYFYNQSIEGKPIIPSGDYPAHRQSREQS